MAGSALVQRTRAAAGGFRRACRLAVARWRAIVAALLLALAAFLVGRSDFFELIALALLVIFVASQVFWLGRVVDLIEWFAPGKSRRVWIVAIVAVVYLGVFVYSFPSTIGQGHTFRPADYRLHSVLIHGAFWWWFAGSILSFVIVVAVGALEHVIRGVGWSYITLRNVRAGSSSSATVVRDPPSSSRRWFLHRGAVLMSATPFVGAGFGFLYGRVDVEVVRQRIRLARLPEVFQGFLIAQLSDFHLGPFTRADYIRRCVAITNGLKPDLVVLTGDYIAWDRAAEVEVVRVLSGLRAPHGVFGCLGNHESEGEIEDSISRSFRAQGIGILRQERAAVRIGGETLNLIGIDEPRGETRTEWQEDVRRRRHVLQQLVMPDTVNLLLVHYPAVFDYVAGHGVDLALAGHTHGGQLSLDRLRRGLNLSRLVTRYGSGLYEKSGSQLYVNRGIGTTGLPVRLGARPEITLIELSRT